MTIDGGIQCLPSLNPTVPTATTFRDAFPFGFPFRSPVE
jgi:hypothetical protein